MVVATMTTRSFAPYEPAEVVGPCSPISRIRRSRLGPPFSPASVVRAHLSPKNDASPRARARLTRVSREARESLMYKVEKTEDDDSSQEQDFFKLSDHRKKKEKKERVLKPSKNKSGKNKDEKAAQANLAEQEQAMKKKKPRTKKNFTTRRITSV
eukprot:scaffold2215_cov162-Amphora_coffeaeformis.AAC.16